MAIRHPSMKIDELETDSVTAAALTATTPPIVPVYTLTTLPSAATYENGLIVVSDATPAALCWSNGTNWIATDDGTTVA